MSDYSPRRISDHSESDEENLSIEWIDQLREFYQQRDDDDDDFDNEDDSEYREHEYFGSLSFNRIAYYQPLATQLRPSLWRLFCHNHDIISPVNKSNNVLFCGERFPSSRFIPQGFNLSVYFFKKKFSFSSCKLSMGALFYENGEIDDSKQRWTVQIILKNNNCLLDPVASASSFHYGGYSRKSNLIFSHSRYVPFAKLYGISNLACPYFQLNTPFGEINLLPRRRDKVTLVQKCLDLIVNRIDELAHIQDLNLPFILKNELSLMFLRKKCLCVQFY